LSLPEGNKWVPVIDRMVYQVYYRAWGMIPVPKAPIEEVVDACKALQAIRGGEISWIIKGRLAKWENIAIFPDITINAWIFYRPIVGHTFLSREGFYKMYFVSSLFKRPA